MAELKAITRVLRREDQVFRVETLKIDINEALSSINSLKEKQQKIRGKKLENLDAEIQVKSAKITQTLQELSDEKSELLAAKSTSTDELIDTSNFMASVKERLRALEHSSITSSELGEISFDYCPACLSPLSEHESLESCGLCKTKYSGEQKHYAYLQLINELNFQIRESELLLPIFQSDIDQSNVRLPQINQKVEQLRSEYRILTENVDVVDAALCEVASEIGFYKSQLINLNEKLEFAEKIEHLRERKEEANNRISKNKSEA